VCAPPDLGGLRTGVGVPLVPIGQPAPPSANGRRRRSTADRPLHAAELVAAQFDTVAAAAEEYDVPVATGVMPTGVWQ